MPIRPEMGAGARHSAGGRRVVDRQPVDQPHDRDRDGSGRPRRSCRGRGLWRGRTVGISAGAAGVRAGSAGGAMVGTSIGAGRRDRALRVAWTGAAIAAGLTEAIGLAAAFFPTRG